MTIFLIIAIVVWGYVLSVLKRGKLDFWYFLIGSVGSFVFALVILVPMITETLTNAVAAVSGILGKISGFYKAYFQYGILFINNRDYNISLSIDYECSGIIEILAFLAMLWFFNVYHFYEKIVISMVGVFWIFAANVLRIFAICTLIYFGGNDIYYLAHTILGRIIFYVLSIILYFHVFTRPQILRQKIGHFHYENS